MIHFNQVSFAYGDDQVDVIRELDLSIDKNEWVALIGHNGSGKSTAAKLMNGLLLPKSGKVTVGGTELNEETYWDIRKKVGMVFQNPENQFVGTTVMDDVAFGLENLGVPREEMKERVDEGLYLVGMYDYREHAPHRLSGGQKQRVAIAGILAIMPDVIIFDEATTMLDPMGRQELLKTIEELREKQEITIIYITHDLSEAALADRMIVMNQGEKWLSGKPREIFKQTRALVEIGLEVPFVTRVADGMKQHGIQLIEEPLHYHELVDQLWKLNSKT